MILSDGTDTREEVRRPGPYCDGMAVVLDEIATQYVDDLASDPYGGPWVLRIGRRLLHGDTQGFKSSERFASVAEAEGAMEHHHDRLEGVDEMQGTTWA